MLSWLNWELQRVSFRATDLTKLGIAKNGLQGCCPDKIGNCKEWASRPLPWQNWELQSGLQGCCPDYIGNCKEWDDKIVRKQNISMDRWRLLSWIYLEELDQHKCMLESCGSTVVSTLCCRPGDMTTLWVQLRIRMKLEIQSESWCGLPGRTWLTWILWRCPRKVKAVCVIDTTSPTECRLVHTNIGSSPICLRQGFPMFLTHGEKSRRYESVLFHSVYQMYTST